MSNINSTHKFIVSDFSQFNNTLLNDITNSIFNYYLKTELGITKNKKKGRVPFEWSDKKGNRNTGSFSFSRIFDFLRENRSFDPSSFNLLPLKCDWLDSSLEIAKPDGPIFSGDQKSFFGFEVESSLGKNFPVKASIDREGVAMSSVLNRVNRNLIHTHSKLIASSHLSVSLSDDWFNDLRMYFNDSVTVVDITLHQIYLMAEYNSLEFGWSFDKDRLGPKSGVRLADKFSWIGLITGRPLDDAANEIQNFIALKNVRNHLAHFDPPCFAWTVEDAVEWLNRIQGLGMLLWKIRKKLKAPFNEHIVKMLLLPKVRFDPLMKNRPSVALPKDQGYHSSTWK